MLAGNSSSKILYSWKIATIYFHKYKILEWQIQSNPSSNPYLQERHQLSAARQSGWTWTHSRRRWAAKIKAPLRNDKSPMLIRWPRLLQRCRRTLRSWTSTSRYLVQSLIVNQWWLLMHHDGQSSCCVDQGHVLILVQGIAMSTRTKNWCHPCRWSSSASSSFCSARSPSKVWIRLPNQSSWESSWPGQFLHRPAPHRPLRHRHLLLPQQLHLRENQQNLVTLWHLWST